MATGPYEVRRRLGNNERQNGRDGHHRKNACSYLRRERPSLAIWLLHLTEDSESATGGAGGS